MTPEVTTMSDQQSSPSPQESLAFSNVLMTSGLVGTFTSTIVFLPFRLILVTAIILGNVTTVLAIFKNHRLQTNTNWILCSLAVADTLNGIALLGFVVRSFIMPELLTSNVLIYEVLSLLDITPIAVSLSHLVAIAIDSNIKEHSNAL
ncbi:hypothetical protein CAPTEDRAFT_215668 [Capitella teleta]|uniref:G-protein coupled receptors family 1 profile domain-containing protein n=1 Tax=Capitella teleta TaxID=283909 RepID=R7U1F5_CAPTE|nr:hypothetical protein CAPTEDRAFT_215668 [Capitella teleta]|eukprot:ELT97025.1 hypothetical protein CAPTEDRAFT_215668 [Capitella teleta]